VRRADNLTTFMCRLSWNLAASTSWNPQGLSRPVMGYFYISTSLSMCAVHNMAVFCSSLISCLPGKLFRYCLSQLKRYQSSLVSLLMLHSRRALLLSQDLYYYYYYYYYCIVCGAAAPSRRAADSFPCLFQSSAGSLEPKTIHTSISCQ